MTRSSSENPMAAMPFARIPRQLAAQGNIRVSKSGMNLSGHNSPAIPNAKPSWTTKHSPKLFMARIPMREFLHWNVREAITGSYERLCCRTASPLFTGQPVLQRLTQRFNRGVLAKFADILVCHDALKTLFATIGRLVMFTSAFYIGGE